MTSFLKLLTCVTVILGMGYGLINQVAVVVNSSCCSSHCACKQIGSESHILISATKLVYLSRLFCERGRLISLVKFLGGIAFKSRNVHLI